MAGKKFGVSVVVSAVDKATANIRKINQEIEARFKPLNRLQSSLKRLSSESGLTKVGQNLLTVGTRARAVGSELGRLGTRVGLIGAAAAAGLGFLIKSVGDAGDKIDTLSNQTGINAQELQKWQHVASMADVTSESFSSGLLSFTKNMGSLRANTGRLYALLNKVNPAFVTQLKNAKSNEEAFSLLQKAMHALPDEQRRMALAAAAFGGAGKDMVNMASLSQDEIRKLKQEAEDLGMILGPDAVKAGAQFDDAMKRASGALVGIRNVIGSELLPIVNDLLMDFARFVRDNKPQIVDFAKAFAAAFRDAVPKVLAAIQTVAGFFGTFNEQTNQFLINWDRVKLALGVVAAIMLGPLIASIASLLVSIVSLSGSLFSFATVVGKLIGGWSAFLPILKLIGVAFGFLISPIGLVVLALGAVVLAIVAIKKNWLGLGDKFKALKKFFGFGGDQAPAGSGSGAGAYGPAISGPGEAVTALRNQSSVKQEAAVRVSFDNVPKGVSVRTEKADKGLDFGFDMTKGPLLSGM